MKQKGEMAILHNAFGSYCVYSIIAIPIDTTDHDYSAGESMTKFSKHIKAVKLTCQIKLTIFYRFNNLYIT